MKFLSPVPVKQIATLISAEKIIGAEDAFVKGINEIHSVEPGDIVFVDHEKYYEHCLHSAATFIILDKELNAPEGKTLLICASPFEAYCTIINNFQPFVPATGNISNTAIVGEGTYIYPSAFVGNNVRIGNNCIIYPHVTIMNNCVIGNNVIIQANTVIGSDAFYYNAKPNREVKYKKMPSCGRVIIEDDVEIGAGCTIDRGVSADTIIGRGTKLDNLIHFGHETHVGSNCLFAAASAVAGSVTIGNNVTVWGQAGISKTLKIGDNATLLAQTGVPSSLEGNKTYFGTPAQEASVKRRELVWVKRIPELWEKVMKKNADPSTVS